MTLGVALRYGVLIPRNHQGCLHCSSLESTGDDMLVQCKRLPAMGHIPLAMVCVQGSILLDCPKLLHIFGCANENN